MGGSKKVVFRSGIVQLAKRCSAASSSSLGIQHHSQRIAAHCVIREHVDLFELSFHIFFYATMPGGCRSDAPWRVATTTTGHRRVAHHTSSQPPGTVASHITRRHNHRAPSRHTSHSARHAMSTSFAVGAPIAKSRARMHGMLCNTLAVKKAAPVACTRIKKAATSAALAPGNAECNHVHAHRGHQRNLAGCRDTRPPSAAAMSQLCSTIERCPSAP